MKTKIAMLCYRVARWLAPLAFGSPYLTLKELYRQRAELEAVRNAARPGLYTDLLAQRIYTVKVMTDATVLHRIAYEEAKIEIKYDEVELRKVTAKQYEAREDRKLGRDYFAKEEAKRRLFSGMVEGFAKSREVDLHLYFRKVNKDLHTIGIRIYFKHDGNTDEQ